MAKLGLGNYSLEIFQGSRGGISALGVEIKGGAREEHHRHFSDIRKMIERSSLELDVKEMSLAIFRRLAEAEAKVHGQKVEEVHFHEVGAVDSIVDIVGTAIAIHHFNPCRFSLPSCPWEGDLSSASTGAFPFRLRPPSKSERDIPVKHVDVEGELVTPTGAAIVAVLSSGVSFLIRIKVAKDRVWDGQEGIPRPTQPSALDTGRSNRNLPS